MYFPLRLLNPQSHPPLHFISCIYACSKCLQAETPSWFTIPHVVCMISMKLITQPMDVNPSHVLRDLIPSLSHKLFLQYLQRLYLPSQVGALNCSFSAGTGTLQKEWWPYSQCTGDFSMIYFLQSILMSFMITLFTLFLSYCLESGVSLQIH